MRNRHITKCPCSDSILSPQNVRIKCRKWHMCSTHVSLCWPEVTVDALFPAKKEPKYGIWDASVRYRQTMILPGKRYLCRRSYQRFLGLQSRRSADPQIQYPISSTIPVLKRENPVIAFMHAANLTLKSISYADTNKWAGKNPQKPKSQFSRRGV